MGFWIMLWENYESGIKLVLVPIIHDELMDKDELHKWKDNPYNIVNNGPLEHPYEFFTNQQAIDYFKRKLRYINSRYAYSPQLVMWEVIFRIR